MKKLLISVLTSLAIGGSFLYGFDLNVNANFSNGYVYKQDFIAKKASYLVSPVDINFSDIQNSLADDEIIYIYPYFGTSDKINVEFGIDLLAAIKLTKSSIVYAIKYDGSWSTFDNVDDFKSALESYATQITDETKKSNFEGDYITQATSNYIIHNKLYVIVTNTDSSVMVPVPTTTTTSIDTTSELTPPPVPSIN